MASPGECETLCSSVATSTCVDVALMSQTAPEGVQSTVNKTIMLDCMPIPYVAFQQLFFKDNVFKPNKVLTGQNALFSAFIENNKRFITAAGNGEAGVNESCSTTGDYFNLFKEMTTLYTDTQQGGSDTLASCWDTCSKINFTKSVSKIKKLTDLTHVCPVECSITLDDMFCALEANDTDLLTIDPETNMPEPPNFDSLPCPPQLVTDLSGDEITLHKDQFVYVREESGTEPECDIIGPSCITLDISQCECTDEDGNTTSYSFVDATQNNLFFDCYGRLITSGTIIVSGIYIDGLHGAGGQYVIKVDGTDPGTGIDDMTSDHEVRYWEQSAVVNITTRLQGKVPLLDSAAAEAARTAAMDTAVNSNTDHEEVDIANKGVTLDVVWRFKVDLTPASSGTGGDNHNSALGVDRKPHGWSYPDYKHSDDRQRKSIPHDESLKLVTSLKKIHALSLINRNTAQGQA